MTFIGIIAVFVLGFVCGVWVGYIFNEDLTL